MRRSRARATTWANWAGNQRSAPATILAPTTEAEIGDAVSRGVAERREVKVVGSGHSFTSIARTDGILLDLGGLQAVTEVDRGANTVTVGAGITLRELNRQLDRLGLALPNLGDIDSQTLAGAIATGTHGTGAGHQSISAAVIGARLVSGDGSVVAIDGARRPDLLPAVQVNLGALGVVTAVTLQCEPAFNLHAVESTLDIDELLEDFEATVRTNEHVEFYWFPHTRTGLLKVNNRTREAVRRRPRLRQLMEDELLANVAFGALNRVAVRVPRVITAAMPRIMTPGDRVEYVAPSHEVFCSPRRVRFVEMEYALDADAVVEAFGRVRRVVESLGRPISFPIEVRVLGADATLLGTASGRPTAYIAVHVYRGTRHDDYFGAVERIMSDYGGRPHWGKLHSLGAHELEPRYPGWARFQAALDELDPDGHFSNDHLDRVLRGIDFNRR